MVLLFQIAGLDFAIRLEMIQEVVPMAKLIVPPECPAFLEGLLNLRGKTVPVVRTADLLGLRFSKGLYTPLIVLRDSYALLVERAVGFFPAESSLPVTPENSLNGCVEAAITAGSRPALLLSVDRLLIEQERQSLVQFAQRLEQRVLASGVPRA